MKHKQLYTEDGWINADYIYDLPTDIVIGIGARGIGKTYGFCKLPKERSIEFMYMRRTQEETDMINKPEFQPFKQLNKDMNWNITTRKVSKKNAAFYNQEEVEGTLQPTGKPIGFTCALSTVATMRGFDASNIEFLFFDECLKEPHQRPIKHEAQALFNAYETMNRNRELKGKKAVKLICMANSNDLTSDLIVELKLVKKLQQMRKRGQEISIMPERNLTIIDFQFSEISEQKRDTALYRLTKGTEFSKMALENDFNEEQSKIKSKSLKEYRPVVQIGEIVIYEHKSDESLYITTHLTGTPPSYGMGDTERARFKRNYFWVWDEYMEDNITFEEYFCEVLLNKAFK